MSGRALLVLALLLCAACATTNVDDSGEAVSLGNEAILDTFEDEEPEAAAAEAEALASAGEDKDTGDSNEEESEVSIAVAESEPVTPSGPIQELQEVVVVPARHDLIHNHVAEAQALLRNIELKYFFTGKGKKETLRGRPVAFALWSELEQEWILANIEIPRPPIKWKPGRKPLPFTNLTPGVTATHVKGTGAERLMFAFSRNGESLKVYGRKFPVFEDKLIKKKQWRAVAQTARPIVYLPFTEDTFDPLFVSGGKDYLMATARRALHELRLAGAPSAAFPGKSLADVVPAEVITTLAVIEQTDDADFVKKGEVAFNEVLSQYGLKRGEAYRYSVSSASAVGPMQFTNRRGNGTYAMTVRRCPEAKLDRDFERGATDLLNAMKAAICLFDIELKQMANEISDAYEKNMHVLGIFPVAAYNGGPKNVKKLAKSIKKMKVKLEELRPPGEAPEGKRVVCPCLWKETADDVIPVPIPRYNNENRWYIEKYQRILSVFEEEAATVTPS